LPLLFISCTSNNQPNVNKKSKIKKVIVKQKQIPKNNTPNWIFNPNKQNHICSIGSASITDKKTTNTIASMKAKSNISKQISIYINSQSKSMKSSNGKSKYTTSSSQQSTNMLRGIKFTDKYKDTENNRYYIRACSKL
jgi:hypothetical protein